MAKKITPFVLAALLLTLAVCFHRARSTDEWLAERVSKNLELELTALKKEAQLISDDPMNLSWSSLHHSFYAIDNEKITSWSKNSFPIPVSELQGKFNLKFLKTSKSDLLICKIPKKPGTLVGIIPLRIGYEIVNRYLTTTWNAHVFPVQGVKILPLTNDTGVEVCFGQQCLFKVQMPGDRLPTQRISLSVTLLAILSTLVGIYFIVLEFHASRRYFTAFLVLFGCLAVERIAMVQFSFPSQWVYTTYFDPKYFASSSFNASVGDFFLNALIVVIASGYLFAVYTKLRIVRDFARKNIIVKSGVLILLMTASFFTFLFPYLFVESIFHDSSIPLDITLSALFDHLQLVALVALAFGYLSSFFFVHMLVRGAKFFTSSGWQFLACVLVSAVIFTTYFLSAGLTYWPTLIVGAAYFSFLYYSKYFPSLASIRYRTFSFLLIPVVAYSLQGAFGIWHFTEEKEMRSLFRSASNLISRDVLGEYLLNEAAKRIESDKLMISGMANPVFDKGVLRQKIKRYLNSYFDRYEVKIGLYNSTFVPADEESEDYTGSVKPFETEVNKTSYSRVYFVRDTSSEATKRYLVIVPLLQNGGYVVLDLSLTQIVPSHVYPELLVDSRFTQSLRNKDYSYAFYRQNKLVNSVGSYNFERDFNTTLLRNSALYSSGIKTGEIWLAGVEGDTEKKAIVATAVYPFFSVLANFSFLFILGVGLIFMALVVYWIAQARKKRSFNYSARIQLYVYLAFVLPLVVVSIMALRMISQSDEALLEKEVREKGLQITETLSGAIRPAMSDSMVLPLQKKLVDITQATSVDANVYAPSGELLASSQPAVFSDSLIMPLPDRATWEKIVQDKFNIVQTRCRIGALEYNSLFFAIKSVENNQLLGILELPFFHSDSASATAKVLANIAVTFTVAFILFSLFAYNTMEKLTEPLRLIARKLKTTSLSNNKPIAWSSNDEIGLMVKQYNRMLGNLEKSKVDMARSQKESAWREIAQQVAHEIKNPLTPMRLTLQQMEQALTGSGISNDRIQKSVQTLLSQVEILNGIAGSFSAFATMPAPVLTKVELISVLKNVVSLFENQALGTVQFKATFGRISVLGDEQLLGRMFYNIILNSIQAGFDQKKVNVEIDLQRDNSSCTVLVKDDGMGIASELGDKIFLPHFSTKKGGSGLGLAIARQGIDQMGGTIRFETAQGQGTTFFIKLRLADID